MPRGLVGKRCWWEQGFSLFCTPPAVGTTPQPVYQNWDAPPGGMQLIKTQSTTAPQQGSRSGCRNTRDFKPGLQMEQLPGTICLPVIKHETNDICHWSNSRNWGFVQACNPRQFSRLRVSRCYLTSWACCSTSFSLRKSHWEDINTKRSACQAGKPPINFQKAQKLAQEKLGCLWLSFPCEKFPLDCI